MQALLSPGGRNPRRGSLHGEGGAVIFVALAFVMVFLILGVALYWLVTSQIRSTDTERTDVKSFNVAEAGIDAGMLSLQLSWPAHDTDPPAAVDNDLLKTTIKAGTQGLWDPKRSDPSEFIHVTMYDNVDASGNTTTMAYPDAPRWDSNGDGRMFVDSTANLGDDRHRILILAEKQLWPFEGLGNQAFWAGSANSNAHGIRVSIEVPPPPGDPPVTATVPGEDFGEIDAIPPVLLTAKGEDERFPGDPPVQSALLEIATRDQTLFTNVADAEDFLNSGEAGGKVVYIKTDSAVVIGGNTVWGSVAEPIVLVLDTPDGTSNEWRGTADFYGILITFGDNTLRGTSGIHGMLWCNGEVDNKGMGHINEVNYNYDVLYNLKHEFVISVNIVPNTWEEYTLPRTTGTSVAGG